MLAKELASIRDADDLPTMEDLESAGKDLAVIFESNGGADGKQEAARLRSGQEAQSQWVAGWLAGMENQYLINVACRYG